MTSSFTWRHATMNPKVQYAISNQNYAKNSYVPEAFTMTSFIPPRSRMDGFIVGWLPGSQGLRPSSFPVHVTPIFSSTIMEQIYEMDAWKQFSFDTTDCDQHNFYWISSEEDAKLFLSEKYPAIYEETLKTLESQ